MNHFSRRVVSRGSWAVAALIALCGITSSAFAQVDYVRDIPVPIGASHVLPIVQAPYVTGDPDATYEIPPLILASAQYYTLDQTSGIYSFPASYPTTVKLTNNSKATWLGQTSPNSGPTLIVVTIFKQILTYDGQLYQVTSLPSLSIDYAITGSIAARSLNEPISLIGDSQHYAVDRLTGEMTAQPLAGVDTATTQFMSYGADGLLYVLDYGNDRIASFDPDNAFASVTSFTLQSGVTTANSQFAIGINGSFYLADGLGGGSTYDATGVFQGVFTLPEDVVPDSYNGQSYINTDADGNIYVFDKNTGIHQYKDVSVVPEPATWGLLVAGLSVVGWAGMRRRQGKTT